MGMAEKLQKAIQSGQESSRKNINLLEEQNKTIIANEDEIIELLKKVCDKLDIKAEVEE